MSDLNPLAVSAHRAGQDPIEWACHVVEAQVGGWDTIRRARDYNPGAFPVYRLPLDTMTLARQVVGHLLDAGWTPPDTATLDAALDEADANTRRIIAILDTGQIPDEIAQLLDGLGEEWQSAAVWAEHFRRGLRRADP